MTIGDFTLDAHWWWLIIAVVLGALEMLIPGVFLIWLAAAAAVTGLIALIFGPPIALQFLIFAGLALIAAWGGRRWYLEHPVESSDPMLNDRAARLIGETVTVVEAIEGGSGRVRVGDSVWNARGEDAEVGAKVRIVGADGTCLKVERLPMIEGKA